AGAAGSGGAAGAARRAGKSAPIRRRPNGAYLRDVTGRLKLGSRRLKVAVDCGNGTAGYIAQDFLERLGCEVAPLYCDPDPNFPNHHPDPVQPANLRDLIALVRREKCDLGVAFDGDGDRLGVVDEKGNILWGDIIMVLYWREILAKHPGAEALIEVKCSQALFEEVERLGGRPSFYRTGHSLIKARMREIGAPFAGEMSGHMFFADEYYGYDDALYATGRLLRILSNSDLTLSELVADVPRYHSSPETRVDCPDADKFRVVEETRERFRRRYPVIDVDGARVLFPEGWGLIRASNTQPALVLRCEAKTSEALRDIAAALSAELAHHPSVGRLEWDI
ncbi:MAG: phosphomannomutase/phosphoglucomutase, partial [Bacillota bacterium]